MTRLDPDIFIHPRQERKERRLPEGALLFVNPAEASFALRVFEKYEAQRQTLYNSNLLVDKHRRLCLAGPALGAPAAGLIMEKLIALGVRDILLISCCGTLDPILSIGDILVAAEGVPGEGVSRYYEAADTLHPSAQALHRLQESLRQQNLSWTEGTLFSTDAPYRESRSELFLLQEQYGVSGVDMEFSALCSIAAFRKISFAGLFIVSDELWGADWKPGFGSTTYRNRSHSVIEAMICQTLQKEQGER